MTGTIFPSFGLRARSGARLLVCANEATPFKSRRASQRPIEARQRSSCYVTRLAGDLRASFHPAISTETDEKLTHAQEHAGTGGQRTN